MVFSSYLFVFYFLPLALGVYYLLPRRGRHLGLTALSYLFYGWANPAFTVLMFASTSVDYLCGRLIGGSIDPQLRRIALVVSVVFNLSLLGFFKYFNFAVDSANWLAAQVGLSGPLAEGVVEVALPLGISFYTFQSMSYTIDVYRGRTEALRSFIDFACYVSMFPQLVAGPIVRYNEVAEQLQQRCHTLEKFARGAALFSLGLGKKVLLANPCGAIADIAFGAGSLHPVDAWYGIGAYAFQIYFDFSGYSDMAIGLGLMLGFVFPKNFDSPYQARSITDFWRRWHLSLSTWLRDYLYIPLGGNRRGPRRTYVNLMVVMLLGGLWHGAAWNFVVWGGVHGLLLAWERWRRRSLVAWLPCSLQRPGTFVVVLMTWVFFRAENLGAALGYLESMFGLTPPQPSAALLPALLYTPYGVLTLFVAGVVTWGAPQSWTWTQRLTAPRVFLAGALLWLALVSMQTQGYNPFIYFIF